MGFLINLITMPKPKVRWVRPQLQVEVEFRRTTVRIPTIAGSDSD